MDATGFAYAVLSLAALVGLANWLAPVHVVDTEGCALNYVYDGDTVALDCPLGRKTTRLVGFDTPETYRAQCNGELESVKQSEVGRSVPLQVFLVYRDFKRCPSCHRVYWRGSHLRRLDKIVERAKNATSAGKPAEEPCGRLRR